MKVGVTDDFPEDRKKISELIALSAEKSGLTVKVLTWSSGTEMLKDLREDALNIPDLCLMDIYMDGMDGIDTAGELKKLAPDVLVVYLTSSREDVFRAVQTHACFDYILKDSLEEETEGMGRIGKLLHDAAAEVERGSIRIRLSQNPRDVGIRLDEIQYITSGQHYLHLVTGEGENRQYRMNFSQLTVLLQDYPEFLTVNRGVCVNLDYARNIDDEKILMKNGVSLPIARRQSKKIISLFQEYQFSKLERKLLHR